MTDLHLYHAGTARDWVTAELQQAPVQWRSIAELDDAAAAQRIVADGIDVLVDLAGHAPGNRLQLFARRPAPVQVTWLDYFDTTAIATMDALVTDPVSTPPDLVSRGAQRFTERLAYLPHARLCYAPPPFAPAEAPLPAQRAGRITFGCFGRADKMLPEVIALWSLVLAAVPGSALVLKNDACDVAPVRERMLASFAAGGIDAERIVFRGPSTHAEMLAEYAAIDIALDTFPYNGGATTCDALWMGIPVITLAGETMIARQGAALLTAAGHPEWIAADPAAYVRIARDLAAGVPALSATRATLRGELARSALCDADAFARDLHAALRQEWVRWCEERAPVECLVSRSAAEVAR
jgi:predicted O-linked N-acetylglucosamine transferase (SPINDLY family)